MINIRRGQSAVSSQKCKTRCREHAAHHFGSDFFFFQISRFAGIRGLTCPLIVDKLGPKFRQNLKFKFVFENIKGLPESGVGRIEDGNLPFLVFL